MACGHLQRLVGLGLLRVSDVPPVRYVFETVWKVLR
jgi:hypothetical protein